ncbi:MAG TPA: polymer-forming cytoskeletal protein [Rectinemataceae bacterium]
MKKGRAAADSNMAPALSEVFLGEGAELSGSLSARGQVRIEGILSGRLESDSLVVLAQGSRVDAEIQARKAVLAGRFSGKLDAKEEVRLAPSAQVEAEIGTASFSMAAGAVFKGRVIRTLP